MTSKKVLVTVSVFMGPPLKRISYATEMQTGCHDHNISILLGFRIEILLTAAVNCRDYGHFAEEMKDCATGIVNYFIL
jgi:hypothetical protein